MVPPLLPSILSPLLFSTTWCVYDPSIHCRCSTSSFLPFHTRGAIPGINSYAFHEHTTTTHTVYSSPPFRFLSHLSISISSHRHWFLIHTISRLLQTYSNISLSSHLPHFLHLFIQSFNPVSHPISRDSTFMPRSMLSSLYPVLMCTFPLWGPSSSFTVV